MPGRRRWIALLIGVVCFALGILLAYKRQVMHLDKLESKGNAKEAPENQIAVKPDPVRVEEIVIPVVPLNNFAIIHRQPVLALYLAT
jgi:hypothetical protein